MFFECSVAVLLCDMFCLRVQEGFGFSVRLKQPEVMLVESPKINSSEAGRSTSCSKATSNVMLALYGQMQGLEGTHPCLYQYFWVAKQAST